MKKRLLILLLIVLCSGCSAKYNLEINKDLSVTEKVVALETSKFYSSYENSSVGRVIGIILSPELEYLNNNNYKVEKVSAGDEVGVEITNSFNNFDDYLATSKAYIQYGSKPEINLEGSIITFHTTGHLTQDGQYQEIYNIDSAEISITLPFVVNENNADKYDKKTHTYTWIVEGSEKKDILIKFNKDKLVVDYTPYIIAIISLIVMVIIGVIAYKIIKKRDKENEI